MSLVPCPITIITMKGLVAECCLLLYEISTHRQIHNPHKTLAWPCHSPWCQTIQNCCTLQRLHLTLQCPTACPGLATHTLAGLCVLWLPSAASSSTKSPLSSKTATPANHLLGPAAAPNAGPFTTAVHCKGCISPCSAPWYARGRPLTYWRSSVRSRCRAQHSPLKDSRM